MNTHPQAENAGNRIGCPGKDSPGPGKYTVKWGAWDKRMPNTLLVKPRHAEVLTPQVRAFLFSPCTSAPAQPPTCPRTGCPCPAHPPTCPHLTLPTVPTHAQKQRMLEAAAAHEAREPAHRASQRPMTAHPSGAGAATGGSNAWGGAAGGGGAIRPHTAHVGRGRGGAGAAWGRGGGEGAEEEEEEDLEGGEKSEEAVQGPSHIAGSVLFQDAYHVHGVGRHCQTGDPWVDPTAGGWCGGLGSGT